MSEKLVTIKVFEKTRQRLRIISALKGKSHVEMIELILEPIEKKLTKNKK